MNRPILILLAIVGFALGCEAQDTVTDTTPPQREPIVFPEPDPSFEISLGAAGLSNLVRFTVGPTLSKPIIRELVVRVDRNELGSVTGGEIEMRGRLTPAQLGTMWKAIAGQWTLPTNVTGKFVSELYLTATNTGTGRVTVDLQ